MLLPQRHWLPPGQPLIETTNVKRFKLIMNLTLESYAPDQQSIITAVMGDSGAGKTVAMREFLAQFKPQLHTGLPKCLGFEVKPRATGLAVAQDIVRLCGQQPRNHNVYRTADDAAEALVENDIHLLAADEAERFNAESFDVIRYIVDRSQTPLAIDGLHRLLTVIDGSGKRQFSNRTSLRMTFEPITHDELLSTILPGITTPLWYFDPNSDESKELAMQIWTWTGSSFRETTRLIQTARGLARRKNAAKIELKHLRDAYAYQEHTEAKNERIRRERGQDGSAKEHEHLGPLEQESAVRRDAKSRGKR